MVNEPFSGFPFWSIQRMESILPCCLPWSRAKSRGTSVPVLSREQESRIQFNPWHLGSEALRHLQRRGVLNCFNQL